MMPLAGLSMLILDLCVGCQYCIAACPYRVRFIHPVTKTADKCDFCRKTNLQAGSRPRAL
ncbi:4Fe-4S binding protein [Escherichia coli]